MWLVWKDKTGDLRGQMASARSGNVSGFMNDVSSVI